MTEEMTRAGLEAEARRRYREAARRGRIAAIITNAILTIGILGGVALLLAFAATKRAERDSRVEMERAHYELMAVTGGAR